MTTVMISLKCGPTFIQEEKFSFLNRRIGNFGSMDSLRKDLREELQAELEKARKLYQGGTGNPPPLKLN